MSNIHDPRQFMPEGTDKAKEHREALMVARDYAAMLCSRVRSESALEHAICARDVASTMAFAEASDSDLGIAVAYCRNLVHASYLAEHLASEGFVQ